ncbi:MAG: hypothetical protein D6815_13025, partial [Candidatus Dadabacteria bacterium]
SASAIHADLYVPIRPGTDAALALAVARHMIATGRYDANFIRSQTDLPLLVREDGRFLRQADLQPGGRTDVFYALDERTGEIVEAPASHLDWGSARPALTGSARVATREGKVLVRPVFEILRERLERGYRLEQVAAICGTPAPVVERFAEIVASARSLAGIAGSCIPKFYHGDLMMRAQILVFVLGGHLGRPGAGYDTCPFLRLDGLDRFGASQIEGLLAKLKMAPALVRKRLAGETKERVLADLMRDYMETANVFSSVLYWREHGHLKERTDAPWGRDLRRPVSAYVERSLASGWQRRPPAHGPRVLFLAGSNLVRRLRSSDLLVERAFPSIDLIVTTDVRMTTSCLYSDILLPGATSYEKDDVPNWFTLLSPFLHITQAAVPPRGEAKPEWTIHALLARAIERRARARGIKTYRDRSGKLRRLDDFYRRFTAGGKYGPEAQSEVAAEVVEKTSFVPATFDELRPKGFVRVSGIGSHPINLGNATDVRPDQPVVNRQWRRTRPGPWPTLTRRIQFYIDHPLYLELGEELPVHKEPPASGGNFPLILTSGHTRWSIHSGWRNVPWLLYLQRGQAAAFVAAPDARARGIRDGDTIRIWNDVGEFFVQAKVSAAVRPGTVILYHAWEDYQFPGRRGYRNVLPSPLNPVELAGDYNHLRPVPASLQPGQNDRDTRVDIAPA